MKLRLLAIIASTALVPAVSLAQTSPSQPPQSTQARPAQLGTQAPDAADFVNRAAISNMFEIQSSQLAQQKSQNDRVRQFAQRMVQDHTAAGDKLKSTAQGIQGITVPTNLDQPHQQMVQTLQSASGAGFDRSYIQMQVTAHREAVNLFEKYAQSGDNQQLKQFAQQTVPTLREHLQTVEQIQNSLPPAQVGAAQPGTASSAGSTTGGSQSGNMGATFVTQREPGMYRASELIGTDVRGGNNEDIGEVGDVLIDRDGRVRAVVVDVGGFLGIGETHVAIPMQQVQFRSGQQNANATGSVGGNTGTTGTNTANTTATTGTSGQNTSAQMGSTQAGAGAGANAGQPNAIIVMMTKDQLQNAPRFQDNNRRTGAGGTTGAGTTPRQ